MHLQKTDFAEIKPAMYWLCRASASDAIQPKLVEKLPLSYRRPWPDETGLSYEEIQIGLRMGEIK